ncbi:hypothetical protein R5R35_011434 [Gryllus longicercus]|uniref:Accessory gland protein n=1 Tax=Gryllus longicercus TaxID=2509291 RepID=A0AAN9V4I9_9ORTH
MRRAAASLPALPSLLLLLLLGLVAAGAAWPARAPAALPRLPAVPNVVHPPVPDGECSLASVVGVPILIRGVADRQMYGAVNF